MPINNPYLPFIIKIGQSTSETAKSGVAVVFEKEHLNVPRVSIVSWLEDKVWLTAVSTTGFTWQSDEDIGEIDWIAIGRNGE